jgi:hypothetical protein
MHACTVCAPASIDRPIVWIVVGACMAELKPMEGCKKKGMNRPSKHT